MAIRTQRLEGSGGKLSAESFRLELEKLERASRQALEQGDFDIFAGLISGVREWDDLHRRLQADIGVLELLSEHRSRPQVWSRMYLIYAAHLMDQLEREVLEPERWNSLGVALYELGETRGAERCFWVVRKLHPEHSRLQHNLKAVKQRRKAGTPKRPFPVQVIMEAKQLAGRAEKLAGTVALPDPASQKLSLVMIVKDEQEMLPECLSSVEGLVDEMIVVDTGSSDKTREIAEEAGAKVLDFTWTGDFSEARNVSLQAATGDWVLHLDADERLVGEDKDRLREMLSRVWLEGFTLVETNYTGEDGSAAAVIHAPLRVWKNRPEYRFSGAIHEQKTDNMPVWLPLRFEATDLRIIHFGYLKELVQGRSKSQRNLSILEAEATRAPSPFNSFNLGNEYALLGNPAKAFEYYLSSWSDLARSGDLLKVGYGGMLAKGMVRQGRLAGSPDAELLCQQALKVFPEHTDLVLEEGYIALAGGDLDRAEQAALKALAMGEAPPQMCGAMGSGTFLAKALLGEVYERQGRGLEAVSVYRESISEYPDYLGSIGSLVRALLREGEEADKVLQEAAPLIEGRLSGAGLLLAHAFYEQEEIGAAESLYLRVMEVSPGNPVARVGLVECALSSGEIDKAVELCGDPVGAGVGEAALLRALIFCLLLQQDYPRVEGLLERDLLPDEEQRAFRSWLNLARDGVGEELDSEAALSLLGMLRAALRLTEVEAAEKILLLTAASRLEQRERLQVTAETFLHTGYLDSAAETWLEAIDTLGPDADSLCGLAHISLAQNRPQEALGLAEDALSIDPEHPTALRMVSVLQN